MHIYCYIIFFRTKIDLLLQIYNEMVLHRYIWYIEITVAHHFDMGPRCWFLVITYLIWYIFSYEMALAPP